MTWTHKIEVSRLVLHRLSAEAGAAGDLLVHNSCEMLLAPESWPVEQLRNAHAIVIAALDDAAAQRDEP